MRCFSILWVTDGGFFFSGGTMFRLMFSRRARLVRASVSGWGILRFELYYDPVLPMCILWQKNKAYTLRF